MLTNEIELHLARVALTMKRVFNRDPSAVVEAMRCHMRQGGKDAEGALLHFDPFQLAQGWGEVELTPDLFKKAFASYRALQNSADWDAPAELGRVAEPDLVYDTVRVFQKVSRGVAAKDLGPFLLGIAKVLAEPDQQPVVHLPSAVRERNVIPKRARRRQAELT